MVTAWVAVDNADEENGCMQVIPGKVWEFVHMIFILEQSEDNHNVTPFTFLSIISPRFAGRTVDREIRVRFPTHVVRVVVGSACKRPLASHSVL